MTKNYPGNKSIEQLFSKEITLGDIGYLVNFTVSSGMKFIGICYAASSAVDLNIEGVVEGSLLYGVGILVYKGHEIAYYLKNKQ